MPIHDWSRVEDASFHDFHQTWLGKIKGRLNKGLLPAGYFAHMERHMGRLVSDVLTLSLPPAPPPANSRPPTRESSGGVAVATRPPKATARLSAKPSQRSSVVVRQSGNNQLVALLELASAANKDRPENVAAYVGKARSALDAGVHLVHLDLLPPNKFTPSGLGGAIWATVSGYDYPFSLERPLAADAFQAGRVVELYANPLAVGDELPEVPLFLSDELYIDLPLAASYAEAFEECAPQDRELLSRSG
jgi:hypothetical protein